MLQISDSRSIELSAFLSSLIPVVFWVFHPACNNARNAAFWRKLPMKSNRRICYETTNQLTYSKFESSTFRWKKLLYHNTSLRKSVTWTDDGIAPVSESRARCRRSVVFEIQRVDGVSRVARYQYCGWVVRISCVNLSVRDVQWRADHDSLKRRQTDVQENVNFRVASFVRFHKATSCFLE